MSLRRAFAGGIAVVALLSVAVRIWLNMDETGNGMVAATSAMLRYYTVWMNAAVGVYLLWIARGGRPLRVLSAGLLLSIIAVALVFHILLAHLMDYEGLEVWVDLGFHTVVPVGFALFWLMFEPKRLTRRHVPIWLSFPLIYCIYALWRGVRDGIYPYNFLDVTQQGALGVGINVLGLTLAFGAGAVGILGLARVLRR